MIAWFIPALVSAFLSAFSAITQKKILHNITALQFSVLLALSNLLLSVPFFFFINYGSLLSAGLLILLGKSVIGVFAFLCVMLALKELQISRALPLLALTPGFVAVTAFIFLGEGLKLPEVIGLVMLLAGTYIIESKTLIDFTSAFNVFTKPGSRIYVLLALLLFTASSVLDKLLLKEYSFTPAALTAFQHLFYALIFYILFMVKSEVKINSVIKQNSNLISWIILVSILTIGYRYTQLWAVSLAPVALVLAVKRTSVFWASLIGGKIFKDTNLIRNIIAAAIIVAGTMLILKD